MDCEGGKTGDEEEIKLAPKFQTAACVGRRSRDAPLTAP